MRFSELKNEANTHQDIDFFLKCLEKAKIVDEYGQEKEVSGVELCFGCHSY